MVSYAANLTQHYADVRKRTRGEVPKSRIAAVVSDTRPVVDLRKRRRKLQSELISAETRFAAKSAVLDTVRKEVKILDRRIGELKALLEGASDNHALMTHIVKWFARSRGIGWDGVRWAKSKSGKELQGAAIYWIMRRTTVTNAAIGDFFNLSDDTVPRRCDSYRAYRRAAGRTLRKPR